MTLESVGGGPLSGASVIVPASSESYGLPRTSARMLSDADGVVFSDGSPVEDAHAAACQLLPDVQVIRQTGTGNEENARNYGFAQAAGDLSIAIEGDGPVGPGEAWHFATARLDGTRLTARIPLAGGGIPEELANA